jgi:hypothetical protein
MDEKDDDGWISSIHGHDDGDDVKDVIFNIIFKKN